MMRSARSVNTYDAIPDSNSEQTQTLQMVLRILSQYWKPLRKMVCASDNYHERLRLDGDS